MKYSWAFIKATSHFFNELMIFSIFFKEIKGWNTQLDDVVDISEVTVSLAEEMATTHGS